MKLLWLAIFLTACSSPEAGKVAARATGGVCVAFERHGQPDSAAVFQHAGSWWFYHPSFGSVKSHAKANEPAPMWCRSAGEHLSGVTNLRFVEATAQPSALPNGCLPTAILRQRLLGGSIVQVSPHHVEHFASRSLWGDGTPWSPSEQSTTH